MPSFTGVGAGGATSTGTSGTGGATDVSSGGNGWLDGTAEGSIGGAMRTPGVVDRGTAGGGITFVSSTGRADAGRRSTLGTVAAFVSGVLGVPIGLPWKLSRGAVELVSVAETGWIAGCVAGVPNRFAPLLDDCVDVEGCV